MDEELLNLVRILADADRSTTTVVDLLIREKALDGLGPTERSEIFDRINKAARCSDETAGDLRMAVHRARALYGEGLVHD